MDGTAWFWVLVVVGFIVYVIVTAKSTEEQLEDVTKGWSLPLIARTYDNNDKGRSLLSEEAAILGRHRYEASLQSGEGGHFRAGTAIATGGLGLLVAGSTHTSGRITLTFKKLAKTTSQGRTQGETGQRGVWSLPQSSAATLLGQLLYGEGTPDPAPKRAPGAGREAVATSVKPGTAVRRIHTVIATFCDSDAVPPWEIRYSIGAGRSRRLVAHLDLQLGRLHFSRTTVARTERQVLNFSGYKWSARPRKNGNWVVIPTDGARLVTLLEVLEATLPSLHNLRGVASDTSTTK